MSGNLQGLNYKEKNTYQLLFIIHTFTRGGKEPRWTVTGPVGYQGLDAQLMFKAVF